VDRAADRELRGDDVLERSDGGVTGPVNDETRAVPFSREQLDRAARRVHEVTAGGIPFGKPSRRNRTTVSAGAIVEVVARELAPALPSREDH